MNKTNRLGAALILSIATAISGCSTILGSTSEGPIQQSPTERTWGAVIDDSTIETLAAVNINKADAAFAKSRIVVVSYNGVVLLAGQVPNERLKELAAETVQKIKKVRKVYNELEISGPIGLPAQSSDSWLTSKIRAQLVAAKGVPSGQIKVVTENGVVYLMGLVKPKEADTVVNLVRQTYGVQKIVKLFEYV